MKLSDQVIPLDQAKRLKELGIEQDSHFYWYKHSPTDESITWLASHTDYEGEPIASAFTVAELGVMLPSETLTIRRGSEDSAYPNWEWEDEGNEQAFGLYASEAEARAAMLIHLLENNLITPAEANKRLAE